MLLDGYHMLTTLQHQTHKNLIKFTSVCGEVRNKLRKKVKVKRNTTGISIELFW